MAIQTDRQRLAAALCACFDYLKASGSVGARRLFDAVNDAYVAAWLEFDRDPRRI